MANVVGQFESVLKIRIIASGQKVNYNLTLTFIESKSQVLNTSFINGPYSPINALGGGPECSSNPQLAASTKIETRWPLEGNEAHDAFQGRLTWSPS